MSELNRFALISVSGPCFYLNVLGCKVFVYHEIVSVCNIKVQGQILASILDMDYS